MKIDRTVVESIRARHEAARPKAGVNPAWANAEHDIGLLLEYIDSFEKINVEPYESPAFRELREMRTLLSMHSPLQQNLPHPIPVTETLFKEIEALQRSDAAWRSAHAVNMARAEAAEKRVRDIMRSERLRQQRYIDKMIRQQDLYKLLRLANFELMMRNDAIADNAHKLSDEIATLQQRNERLTEALQYHIDCYLGEYGKPSDEVSQHIQLLAQTEKKDG